VGPTFRGDAAMTQARTCKAGRWSERELRYLIESAGRVPKRTICRKLNRRPEEVEAVAARVRATGYPISLDVETCPMCGRRAPIVYSLGICKPCKYKLAIARERRQTAELLRLVTPGERESYAQTEAWLRGRAFHAPPKPPAIPEDATEAERAAYEDAFCEAVAEWDAHNLHRQLKAAQKRKERIARKARANGAEVPTHPKWEHRALATA